jgi:hypothetical protein
MPEDLLNLVNEELLAVLTPLGFEVVHSETSDSFDNGSVLLEAPDLRIRIVRERGQVFADFGPPSEPNTWFDSAVVTDYLGLSSRAGFHDRNARGVLQGVGAFVTSFHDELGAKFDRQHLANAKKELDALKEIRAAKLFGA